MNALSKTGLYAEIADYRELAEATQRQAHTEYSWWERRRLLRLFRKYVREALRRMDVLESQRGGIHYTNLSELVEHADLLDLAGLPKRALTYIEKANARNPHRDLRFALCIREAALRAKLPGRHGELEARILFEGLGKVFDHAQIGILTAEYCAARCEFEWSEGFCKRAWHYCKKGHALAQKHDRRDLLWRFDQVASEMYRAFAGRGGPGAISRWNIVPLESIQSYIEMAFVD